MQVLNISVVQTELIWEDIDANLSMIESMISGIEECDLFILPEMFSTGFSMKPEQFAKDSTAKTLPWMKRLSHTLNAAICGSFMHEDDGKYYNALTFVLPDGKVEWYYKRHLFSPGEESIHYTKGDKRLEVDYKGWKICPLICYDLRFPVYSRNTNQYDLLIYIANWPSKRNYAWQQLLKARAIENQSFVVACNRLGNDANGIEHIGNSCIINYMGEEIGFGKDKKVFRFNLAKELLLDYRKDFPVLDDRDDFEIL